LYRSARLPSALACPARSQDGQCDSEDSARSAQWPRPRRRHITITLTIGDPSSSGIGDAGAGTAGLRDCASDRHPGGGAPLHTRRMALKELPRPHLSNEVSFMIDVRFSTAVQRGAHGQGRLPEARATFWRKALARNRVYSADKGRYDVAARGRGGGLHLDRPPKQITLRDI
jgi:hypothetical protein